MDDTHPQPPADRVVMTQGRQTLFYVPVGLLGGTFSCSRCGATGRQPDLLDHAHDCAYRQPDTARP